MSGEPLGGKFTERSSCHGIWRDSQKKMARSEDRAFFFSLRGVPSGLPQTPLNAAPGSRRRLGPLRLLTTMKKARSSDRAFGTGFDSPTEPHPDGFAARLTAQRGPTSRFASCPDKPKEEGPT